MADLQRYREHYSREAFREKVRRYGRVAGARVMRAALQLYYALRADTTPAWAKGVILGALGYFILPTDLVPDFLAGVGYTDDLSALLAALGTVAAHITPEMKARADARVREWFGEEAPDAT